MMNDIDKTSKDYKAGFCERLKAIDIAHYHLEEISSRLVKYVTDVRDNTDDHNLYEILAVLRFFSFMDRYVFRVNKVHNFVRLYESLKFSGLKGRRKYKLTPIQYFQFASILGFYFYEESDMTDEEDTDLSEMSIDRRNVRRLNGKLLRRYVEHGQVYELRRLTREAILFVPRKFSKTTSTASLAVNEMLFGDANAQAYTAANSYTQASICFSEISKIMRQLDAKKKYIKPTRVTLKWKPNRFGKESFIECLTGGADTKDGLNASLVIYDEYAAAKYVRGHSDGAELMQVLRSSMGTRTEPLTIIITTASRVPDGPFVTELNNAKSVLEGEYEDDQLFASIFQPDAWEMADEAIGDERVWRKCNPHIGITVRPTFYKNMYKKALHDAESMLEFKTKMLNIFVADNVKQWISGSLVRAHQQNITLDNIKGRPMCMVGLDLSISDDLSAVVYNIYSPVSRKFYVFLMCYIPEETLKEHANRKLYEVWIANGWMKACKGAVIDGRMIVDDILGMRDYVNIIGIGYDAYKSQEVINGLAAAIQGLGYDPKGILRAVPQNYGSFTSPVETFELAIKMNPARVVLCNSPIFPWAFDNAFLDQDKMENKKPLKRKQNLKIDPVISTLETFWLYNNYEVKNE